MKKFFKIFAAITGVLLITFLFTAHNKSGITGLSDNDSKVEKESGGALEYMQFLSEMRAFPNKDIPPDKYFKAFEYSKNNLQEIDNGDSPTAWTSLGPNNIGGRSLCIAINPADTSMLFMGSASGGIWKSTTGGLGATAWTYVETGYPSLAVSSIAIDSTNPNIIYIGTGECYGYQFSKNGLDVRVTRGMYGIGILKTTDGGTTWTKSLDWAYNNQRGVWKVVINPRNHNTLYAATTEGIYKSNNSGTNWSQVLNYQMVMDLKINPADTTVLYASVGDLSNNIPNANVGIYKTTNAGSTWNKLTGGLPAFWSGKATLDIYQGNSNTVYASIANDVTGYVGFYVSTDAGTTWQVKATNVNMLPQGWYNNAILVKANDPNTIVVGTIDLVKSTNGGTSFTTKSDWGAWNTGATPPGQPESASNIFAHADHHYYVSNPREPNKLYCITDGGLYRSNDFGETYYSCNGGYVTTQFYNGFGNSMQDSIFCLGGLQDNRSAFYQGTTAWYKTFVGDGFWCAVNSTNQNICYTEYSYGDINKSTSGGVANSWNDIAPPGTGSEATCCFAAPYICCRSNSNIMYAGNMSIYRSTNGGNSWQGPYGSFAGAKVLSMDGSATFTDTVYCGTIPVTNGANATVWKTTNGTTWTNIGGGVLPNAYPTDIHVNPNNSMDVYVTFSGFGNPHVYRSSNGGSSWQNITGNLPDVPHQSVVIDPLYTQNVYVGNDLGVYFTSNSGATWYAYGNGMPYAMVFDLSIVYPNRHIRATTHGHGVYERSLVQNPNAITTIGNSVPKSFNLYQNYPNPFNPETKIKFSVPLNKGGNRGLSIQLKIYDILGKEVAILVSQQLQPATYEVEWNATNYPSGVYFYKLISGEYIETKKMLLLK
jgi:photosystem II stability/assembly factor-like uncharacterized protein